ncbi:NADPH2:quinone reductase [Marinobacter daqiaonensis]|uniref:NADPH2:quinone reductase n=1 Tax=Marinobacter daqiaonensis TaxID=650891 RepID=A0A1I6IN82_9GAMM|nr:NADPH:quinone oxidoreductase family protein [Marinobacter daqiaonensis]SFR68168.1 NADPH2:quinone reductase [Marinobacter daqiaonensis]
MKAVLCRQYGPPESLAVEDIPSLEPAEGEVIISVHSCAANFPDTLIIEGKYQFKRAFPFVPGGEVAGTIKSVGKGVEGFAPGDRVIGIPGWGGFAEETPVSARKVVRLPDPVSMDAGAALVITYGTTHYALEDRARLQPGETLLALGAAGGTGLAAIELGKVMGAHVIAAASTDEKLEVCRQHGADETINYSQDSLRERIRELTDGRGVDVVYDPVGGEYSEPALRGMAWNGRYLVIGFTAGEIPRLPLNLPLLKGCAIVGVFYGAFQEKEPARFRELMGELTDWLAEGRIKPRITARYPLEETARALIDLKERRATGKLIVYTGLGRDGG